MIVDLLCIVPAGNECLYALLYFLLPEAQGATRAVNGNARKVSNLTYLRTHFWACPGEARRAPSWLCCNVRSMFSHDGNVHSQCPPPPSPDFIISTVAALVCWRAMRKNSGPVAAPPPPASPKEKNARPDLERQATDNEPPVQAPSSTTLSTPTATTCVGSDPQAQTRCGGAPVPRGLRWPLLILWNIACIGSLIVTLVWFTEDVSE